MMDLRTTIYGHEVSPQERMEKNRNARVMLVVAALYKLHARMVLLSTHDRWFCYPHTTDFLGAIKPE